MFAVSFLLLTAWAQPYDIVLNNGRVMDPESGLDAVRHVGIRGKRIAAISTKPLRGRLEVDVKGLVVAPGFIDLHSHGQTAENYRFKARDGVTTALEQEVGASPVSAWYAAREGKALVHFGASVGHLPARMAAMKDTGDFLPRDAAVTRAATMEERRLIREALAKGLSEGALGIGFGFAYTPLAGPEEIQELFALAASARRPAFVHMRYGSVGDPGVAAALQEVIAYAAVTGASVHVVHIGASSTRKLDLAMSMIEGARKRGLDITTEAYPYVAGMTNISSAIFKGGWQRDLGISYSDLMWAATGERLTA
ncbi:MAG: amidohydrolase family protein, partial [Bryobacteraceae bacterium]|nr:amidohydrolase family protein [Bryobacteraceae bacterium]